MDMNLVKKVEDAILDIKNKKIIIVTDDEDRENEGDFICAGEYATPENINFMATYGKGLICCPVSLKYANHFQLDPMLKNNTDNHQTAFTISIDHVDTTTGISAYERSLTIIKLTDLNNKASDFRRPGHMFPLVAKDGGVLVRNGHTEATIDLVKLAGLKEVGVCCEIMDDDGTMMKYDKLAIKAKEWNMKMISIKELQEYIRIKNRGE